MNNFYIKQSPLTGMVGYGGGITGLTLHEVSAVVWYGDRGLVIAGHTDGSASTAVDFFDITSAGNASDFGDCSQAEWTNGASNGERAFSCGGTNASGTPQKFIQSRNISNAGNFSNWGNLTSTHRRGAQACNGTRSLAAYGEDVYNNTSLNTVEYFDATTSSNGSDFGDLTAARYGQAGMSDATRAVFVNGHTGSGFTNDMDYFTIDTTGNASDWGESMDNANYQGACSNGDRGLIGGGNGGSNNQYQYITFATISGASAFGYYGSGNVYGLCGLGNATRACFAGGLDSNSNSTNIDYVVYQTTSNGTDFGDLNAQHYNSPGGASGAAS